MGWTYQERDGVEFRVRQSDHGFLAEAVRGNFVVRDSLTCIDEPMNASCFFAYGKTASQALFEVAKHFASLTAVTPKPGPQYPSGHGLLHRRPDP